MSGWESISNSTIEVNDVPIAVLGNSVLFKSGAGDKTVRSVTAGGSSIKTVVSEDAETKKSMFQFSVVNNVGSIDLIQEWQANGFNTIRHSSPYFVRNFTNMHVITDPEIGGGADGSGQVTFEGDPVK